MFHYVNQDIALLFTLVSNYFVSKGVVKLIVGLRLHKFLLTIIAKTVTIITVGQ